MISTNHKRNTIFDRRIDREILISILAIVILSLIVHLTYIANKGIGRSPAYTIDDSLITLRYAQDIAWGHGFTFNPNEHVLGTTTPLYALVMAVPALFNMLVDTVAAILLFFVFREYRIARIIAPVLYLIQPIVLFNSAGGMEMSLLILICLATAWLFWTERFVLAGIGCALAVICRVDAIWFALALAVVAILTSKRIPRRFIVSGLIAIIPWTIFAFDYFGTVIPESASAKLVMLTGSSTVKAFYDVFNLPIFITWICLAVIGIISLLPNILPSKSKWNSTYHAEKIYAWLLTLIIWLLEFSLFLTITHVEISEWYHMSQVVIVLILAAWGIDRFIMFYRRCFTARRWKLIAIMATFSTVAALTSVNDLAEQLVGTLQPDTQGVFTIMHWQAGLWLQQHSKPNDVVMAGNIGFIGYFSHSYILDDVGLVSPQVLPLLIQDNLNRSILITEFHPDYLVIEQREYTEIADTIKAQGYILQVTFSYPDSIESPYRIFVRPDHISEF